MNRKFNGQLAISKARRYPKGYQSKAAKAAFADILSDPDMKIKGENSRIRISIILTEEILIGYE